MKDVSMEFVRDCVKTIIVLKALNVGKAFAIPLIQLVYQILIAVLANSVLVLSARFQFMIVA